MLSVTSVMTLVTNVEIYRRTNPSLHDRHTDFVDIAIIIYKERTWYMEVHVYWSFPLGLYKHIGA